MERQEQTDGETRANRWKNKREQGQTDRKTRAKKIDRQGQKDGKTRAKGCKNKGITIKDKRKNIERIGGPYLLIEGGKRWKDARWNDASQKKERQRKRWKKIARQTDRHTERQILRSRGEKPTFVVVKRADGDSRFSVVNQDSIISGHVPFVLFVVVERIRPSTP